jgi:hypothetical protein
LRNNDSNITPIGGYRNTTRSDASLPSSPTNDAAYNRGQYGPLTPVASGYEDSRTTPAGNASQANADNGQTSGWNTAPMPRPQDRAAETPPALPARNAYNDGAANSTATPANSGYNNAQGNYPQNANPYANQFPGGAAPPLLTPPGAPSNYGYAPAGYPPYQMAAQPGAGYGYGQTPGYYAMPPLAPPVLSTASNTTESSSKTRSRRDEEEEEEEDRPRRTQAAPAAATPTPPPTPQGNIVSSEPWLAFTVTILLLFASIGGNIYLLWISQDFYWRYKELANDLRTFNSSAS